jgi:halocin C8-like bacteriocin domain-containing protein
MSITPALACPAGTDCLQAYTEGSSFGQLSDITTLNSAVVDKHIQNALKVDDTQKLIETLVESGYELNKAEAMGLSTILDGIYYEAIGIPFVGADNSDGTLVVITNNDEIIKTQATIIHRDEDKFPISVDVLTVTDSNIKTESATMDGMFGAGVKTSVASAASIASSSPVRYLDQVTASSVTCSACKALYDVACNVGCGVGMAVLCSLAGLTTGIGGIACATIAALVCYAIDQYGCDYGGQAACVVIGYC